VGAVNVGATYWTEMDMSGSFFTGLSASTTLTINEIVYIERFPTQDDLDLIVSAKRSPEYDIKALEAYSIIAQSLPVAVPFSENGLGDWFKSAVNTAAEYLTPALKVIPHPYAQAAATFIGGAKTIVDSFDQPASDTSVPNAPSGPVRTYAPKQRRGKITNVVVQAAKRGLKKQVKREVKRDLQVVIGKNAPRAPPMGRRR